MARGRLIVFEGLDSSGKSTQARQVARELGARLMVFPNRESATGRLCDRYLCREVDLDPRAAALVFAANRREDAPVIEAGLRAGHDIVLDRYAPSGIAYAAAKGLPRDWCAALERGLPQPDVVVFLDVPERVAAARAGFGEEVHDTIEFQRRVAAQFMALREESTAQWISVDADGPVDAVTGRVLAALERIIN